MPTYQTGAVLSPRSKLAQARPHQLRAVTAPASYFNLAPKLSVWGNDRWGDCVTAEEAAAKAGTVLYTDAEVVSWARSHGDLNGADLITVIEQWEKDGIRGYLDGQPQAVQYTDYQALCAAIYEGQVKIAVAARQLESANAGPDGCIIVTASRDSNLNHCVGLSGYGTLRECVDAVNAYLAQAAAAAGNQPPMLLLIPAHVDPSLPSLIMFTWGGYQIVVYSALLGLMDSTPQAGNSEAWVRIPTTVGVTPPTPAPAPVPPGPGPAPMPPAPTPTPTPPSPAPWCHPNVAEAVRHLLRAGHALIGE